MKSNPKRILKILSLYHFVLLFFKFQKCIIPLEFEISSFIRCCPTFECSHKPEVEGSSPSLDTIFKCAGVAQLARAADL